MYLETLKSMEAARRLYRRFGFEALDGPMGATGHSSCNYWMSRKLEEIRQDD
jgi:putative acetyltransferase